MNEAATCLPEEIIYPKKEGFAGITGPLKQASDLAENVLNTVKADRAEKDEKRRVMAVLSPILRCSYVLKLTSQNLPEVVVVLYLLVCVCVCIQGAKGEMGGGFLLL